MMMFDFIAYKKELFGTATADVCSTKFDSKLDKENSERQKILLHHHNTMLSYIFII